MPARPRTARRATAGFTMAEVLVALLIVVMVSIIVANGAPSAINAYRNAVTASNAQVALTTTTNELRSEFGFASKVVLKSGKVDKYLCGENYWASIENAPADDSARAPMKQAYTAVYDNNVTWTKQGNPWAIVPNAALAGSQVDLRVSFDSITFDQQKRTFTVSGIKVTEDGKPDEVIARIGDTNADSKLVIAAPYCVVEQRPEG